jgi:hypothetical protein
MEGIVNPLTCLRAEHVEVLTPSGNVVSVNYRDLKAFCYVSENAEPDLFDVYSLFERRPKTPGLWTRFTFRDSAKLDGMLEHNLLFWPEQGYLMTPPHASAARQRVFIPRMALSETELLGVVGKPGMARRKGAAVPEQQLPMFE